MADEIHRGQRPGVHVAGVPGDRQLTAGSCGANALASVLARWGIPAAQGELDRELYIPAVRGALTVDLWRAARARGLAAWETDRLDGTALERLLRHGAVPIVLVRRRRGGRTLDHYLVLTGFDVRENRWIVQAGRGREELLEGEAFEEDWALAGRWALLVAPPGSETALRAWAEAERRDWRPWNNLADLFGGQGRLPEADRALGTAFELAEGVASARPYLLDTRGALRLAQGRTEEALRDFEEALAAARALGWKPQALAAIATRLLALRRPGVP